jgi:hypothetical protein
VAAFVYGLGRKKEWLGWDMKLGAGVYGVYGFFRFLSTPFELKAKPGEGQARLIDTDRYPVRNSTDNTA